MSRKLKNLLREFHALESVDHRWFQPRARLLQSLWRHERGFEPHVFGDKTYGAWLAMPWAKKTLANYLTDTIREVVRQEVIDADPSRGRLFGKPRIWNNLLSSQPLCFNLFGELQQDLELASEVVRDLTDGRMKEVTRIRFEYSPGRGELRYTGDRSAFDVYLETRTASGGDGFIGIEVKYHENLKDDEANHRLRYDEVTQSMGCFDPESLSNLKAKPLEQIWRDHMLAGAHLDVDGFEDGFFVLLYPQRNEYCAEAVEDYQACLTDSSTFVPWTLEQVHDALAEKTDAEWVEQFYGRYLNFAQIEELLSSRLSASQNA